MTELGDSNQESSEKSSETAESKILAILVTVSILAHLSVLFLDMSFLFSRTRAPIEEIAISADIFPDIDMGGASETALPDVEKAEEVKVQKRILPQLPTKFKIKQDSPTPEDWAIVEAIKKKEQKKKEDELKKLEKLEKLEKLKKEELERKKEAKKKEIILIKKRQKDATELKKLDALARLLKEQARKKKKFAKKTSAPLSKKLAQRKKELADKLGVGGGSGLSAAASKRYAAILRKSVRRHYALPKVYNLENADLVSKIRVVLNSSGGIRELKIEMPSGNANYDNLALKAVRDSAPFPKPPSSLVGQSFILNFSPSTM